MSSVTDYDDEFDGVPVGGGMDKSLKNLPDGKYKFGIVKASYKTIASTVQKVVELEVEVLTDGPFAGKKYQSSYFLTKKSEDGGGPNEVSVGIFKKDLKTLGFADVGEWTALNGRPFAAEMKKALKAIATGVEFLGTKKMNAGGYANLYIDERCPTDGKPEVFTKEYVDKLTAVPFDAEADYS